MTHRIALFLASLALAGSAVAQAAIAPAIRFGGEVVISEPVEGPVHAAGGTITVSAPVNGRLFMAGGQVVLAPAAAISGDASIAAGEITIDGSIKGDLRAAGGEVRIDGPVTGDASIAAGTLELGPAARIGGKLTFRGGELRRDPGAQVVGGVEQSKRGGWHAHAHTATERLVHGWIWSAGLMVLAALIAAAFPGVSQRMAQELRERPWITPLVGLVALITIPIASALLVITIIGIPVAVLALIGYLFLLLVGYVWVAVVTGGMLLDRVKPETAAKTAWRVGAAVLAMLALALLVRVPLVGHFIKLIALIMGMGMIVTVIFRKSQPPTESRPA